MTKWTVNDSRSCKDCPCSSLLLCSDDKVYPYCCYSGMEQRIHESNYQPFGGWPDWCPLEKLLDKKMPKER